MSFSSSINGQFFRHIKNMVKKIAFFFQYFGDIFSVRLFLRAHRTEEYYLKFIIRQ